MWQGTKRRAGSAASTCGGVTVCRAPKDCLTTCVGVRTWEGGAGHWGGGGSKRTAAEPCDCICVVSMVLEDRVSDASVLE